MLPMKREDIKKSRGKYTGEQQEPFVGSAKLLAAIKAIEANASVSPDMVAMLKKHHEQAMVLAKGNTRLTVGMAANHAKLLALLEAMKPRPERAWTALVTGRDSVGRIKTIKLTPS